jgi:hypothetical protein
MGNADENPVFFDMPTNPPDDAKGSTSACVETTRYKK